MKPRRIAEAKLGGIALEALTLIGGLSLGMLGLSGIYVWWRRRGTGTL